LGNATDKLKVSRPVEMEKLMGKYSTDTDNSIRYSRPYIQ
jgi:hypothetical protein